LFFLFSNKYFSINGSSSPKKLKIKSSTHWTALSKTEKFPKDLPVNPFKVYKKEWEVWGTFLDTGNVKSGTIKFTSYKNAKMYARSLNLVNSREWNILSTLKKMI
jgi:hypothetical protein